MQCQGKTILPELIKYRFCNVMFCTPLTYIVSTSAAAWDSYELVNSFILKIWSSGPTVYSRISLESLSSNTPGYSRIYQSVSVKLMV